MCPINQQYAIENLGTSLIFTFPYRKLWSDILTYVFSLVSIVVFFIFFFPSYYSNNPNLLSDIFFLLVLVVIILATGLGMIDFLWVLFGREIVEITSDEIIVRHYIFGFGLAKRFELEKINGVFVSREKNDWLIYSRQRIPRVLDFKKGKVAINYGKTLFGGQRTYRIGSSLDAKEASKIVALIHQRFPQYKYNRKETG